MGVLEAKLTDDEIMERAAEIQAKRDRQNMGFHFMSAKNVQLVAFSDKEETMRLFVPQDPNLAAILCRLLDVETLGKWRTGPCTPATETRTRLSAT
jgi:hypothetical protein